MRLLKTNTAVRVSVGPFLDYEEGTPETALTVTNTTCEMIITPNDGSAVTRTAITLSVSGGDNDMVHITNDVGGYYDLELTQTQTNFLGRMRLAFTDADVHMSLWEDFLVVSANIFNTLVVGSDYLDVATVEQANIDFGVLQKLSLNAATPASVGTVTGNVDGSVDSVTDAVTITSNADITAILEDTGTTLDTLIKDIPTVTEFEARSLPSADYTVVTDTIAGVTTINGLAAGVITAASIATGAIDADALATDAVTEITDAIKNITIDGAMTLLKAVKLRLAKDIGAVVVDGNTIKYYDQSGVLLLTDPITITGSTRVVV